MDRDRIAAISGNPKIRSVLRMVEAGETDFSHVKINDIIRAYTAVTDYFFKLDPQRDGLEEKKIVGPWILALYRVRARKWADRGIEHLDEQIRKAERRRRDPDYMQLFDDFYREALHAERKRITSNESKEV